VVRDEDGISPLHLSASMGSVAFTDRLVSLGCSVSLRDSAGDTALHKAAIKGSADVIEILCKKSDPETVNALNLASETAHSIVEVSAMPADEKKRALQALLDNQADPLLFQFYRSLSSDSEEEIEELLKRGVSIRYPLVDGRSPLVIAVEQNQLLVMEIVLKKGSNPNSRDKAFKTPLHYASTVQAAEILILYGARPELEDKYGKKSVNSRFSEEELNVLERARQSYLKFSTLEVSSSKMPSSIVMTWIKDDFRDDCMLCYIPFTFVVRRHHCRLCGLLLCGDCCTKKVTLKPGTSTTRCCDCCFNLLRPLNEL
jgi:ankyrin repeat protein